MKNTLFKLWTILILFTPEMVNGDLNVWRMGLLVSMVLWVGFIADSIIK